MCLSEPEIEREKRELVSLILSWQLKLDCKLIQRRNNVDFPFICFVRKVQKTRQTNKKIFCNFFQSTNSFWCYTSYLEQYIVWSMTGVDFFFVCMRVCACVCVGTSERCCQKDNDTLRVPIPEWIALKRLFVFLLLRTWSTLCVRNLFKKLHLTIRITVLVGSIQWRRYTHVENIEGSIIMSQCLCYFWNLPYFFPLKLVNDDFYHFQICFINSAQIGMVTAGAKMLTKLGPTDLRRQWLNQCQLLF